MYKLENKENKEKSEKKDRQEEIDQDVVVYTIGVSTVNKRKEEVKQFTLEFYIYILIAHHLFTNVYPNKGFYLYRIVHEKKGSFCASKSSILRPLYFYCAGQCYYVISIEALKEAPEGMTS